MNNDYWIERRARQLHAQLADIEQKNDLLTRVYTMASARIEEQAQKIIKRFELKRHLSRAEAMRLLNKTDNTDARQIAKMLPQLAADDLKAELEAPAYAARLARLREVQDNVDVTVRELASVTDIVTTDALRQMANDTYYHTIYDIQQRTGAAFPFTPLQNQTVDDLLASHWSGDNYSSRIWKNTDALAKRVKEEILTSVLTGTPASKAARNIAAEFGVTASQARRLLRTEACYVDGQIRLKEYKDLGVERYIYVAILDLRTSKICRAHDKKRYLVKNAQVGVNYPPLHPWCRSSTIEDMPDELLARLTQSAINPKTGEQIEVPLSMTYDEWRAMFEPKAVDIVPMTWEGMRAPIEVKYESADWLGLVKADGLTIYDEGKTPRGVQQYVVQLDKRITIQWENLPKAVRENIEFFSRERAGKPLYIQPRDLNGLHKNLDDTREYFDRLDIKRLIDDGYEPVTMSRFSKYNSTFVYGIFKKDGEYYIQVGRPEGGEKVSDETMNAIYAREKIVSDELRAQGVRFRELTSRGGSIGELSDEWVAAMTKFHTIVEADMPMTLTTREQYDALKGEELYRGIAPRSTLRRHTTMDKTADECAEQLILGGVGDCFPSKGVYGDGVAYTSNSTATAYDYATDSRRALHGGVAVRFKLKDDARGIEYDDAVRLFNEINAQHKDDGTPYFNRKQIHSSHEVGKAMQMLGYDYIFEKRGDMRNVHFYIILRRDACVAVADDWIEFRT